MHNKASDASRESDSSEDGGFWSEAAHFLSKQVETEYYKQSDIVNQDPESDGDSIASHSSSLNHVENYKYNRHQIELKRLKAVELLSKKRAKK